MNRALLTLESGEVTRYHAVPTVQPQNLAHHQWNVAVIGLFLWPTMRKELLVELLHHDTGEVVTGDIPYTIKRDYPELKRMLSVIEHDTRHDQLMVAPMDLTPEETALLKMADTLDGFIWCAKHEQRGPVEARWHEAYLVARAKFGECFNDELWERADGLFARFGGLIP